MNEVVLDASALLVLINQEKGYQEVEESIANSCMSTVNMAEVAAILTKIGFTIDEARETITNIVNRIIEFDAKQACISASIYEKTKKFGLSLGDRACLSLGIDESLLILTADKVWSKLSLGIEIKLIR